MSRRRSREFVSSAAAAAAVFIEQLELRTLRSATLTSGLLSIGPDQPDGDDVITLTLSSDQATLTVDMNGTQSDFDSPRSPRSSRARATGTIASSSPPRSTARHPCPAAPETTR